MAGKVQELRLEAGDGARITTSLGHVDPGRTDLPTRDGSYPDRAGLVPRTAAADRVR